MGSSQRFFYLLVTGVSDPTTLDLTQYSRKIGWSSQRPWHKPIIWVKLYAIIKINYKKMSSRVDSLLRINQGYNQLCPWSGLWLTSFCPFSLSFWSGTYFGDQHEMIEGVIIWWQQILLLRHSLNLLTCNELYSPLQNRQCCHYFILWLLYFFFSLRPLSLSSSTLFDGRKGVGTLRKHWVIKLQIGVGFGIKVGIDISPSNDLIIGVRLLYTL